MTVTTAMVLLVKMITIFIIAPVMMHPHCWGMAVVQLIKNMPAIAVKCFCMDICKKLL